ncbi:E3 ubiquitin-protein ligase TRIM9 isoform X1 [Cimex lectularius]|uniref:E3 ubiquitin-protein ligase TRIM9 n=1 Tax=Cimex lectularius TaxID=79782 RepID=A0A8I6RTR8_CIMLE|nr:E3 ubiquitin-protein ligase TRIM9 isoform X1 [Cimex lectularius]
MEDELRCPVCKELFSNPVLMPCYHALCLNCALLLQVPAANGQEQIAEEVDKLSILSETDSGVVCTSRPNSYVGTPNIQGILFPPLTSSALALACPVCSKTVYFDENGAQNLPKYRAMQNIVDKYSEAKELVPKCELCTKEPAKPATVLCEQCEVHYCDECRENCHPARGALAKHTLTSPGRSALRIREAAKEVFCQDHQEEPLSYYCMLCKVAVCAHCRDTRHASHDVQAINTMCKAQKTELSQNLQQLSEKARSTTEFIQRLKGMTDKIGEHCNEFEEIVIQECDELISALEARKLQLVEYVRQEKDGKVRALKDQVAACTGKLQHTTALMHFCIEALKENDSSAFLQIGTMLISRVANEDMVWYQDPNLACPRVSPYCDLTLDQKPLAKAIEQLNFIQMRPAKDGEERIPAAPNAPVVIPEECSAENNSVTVAWQPPPTSYVEGYVLELDDGNGGEFREVYCGKETICTVDGLHFNSTYNARVKAFNSTGEGEYSELIGLQTAEVAWFTFDPGLSGMELRFSEDNCSVSACEGYEHRVALGSVGFSRGVHYWEFTIDRYNTDTDPSFGIARIDVSKDQMLGKDEKGWGMYIDRQRSWFVHANMHGQRCEGGIQQGSTVGVLLDLNRHQVSFYVNEEPHGPIAFHNLYGVFYPAVSVNRGVTVTLHTALDLPSDIEDS